MASQLISVVVPAKDADAYLPRAVENLSALDYPRIELIMVDDGSEVPIDRDRLVARLPRFERVEVIRNERPLGPGPARNLGLERARGHWVWFADVDDTWDPSILSVLSRSATQAEAGVAVCGFEIASASPGDSHQMQLLSQETRLSAPEAMGLFLDGLLMAHVMTKLFSTSLLRSVGSELFPPQKLFEDAVGFMRVLCQQPKVVMVPEVLYNYYQNSGSLTRRQGEYTKDLRLMGDAVTDAARLLRPADKRGLRLFVARFVHLMSLHYIAHGVDKTTSRRERRQIQRCLRRSGLLWRCRWHNPELAMTIALSGWCFPAYRAIARAEGVFHGRKVAIASRSAVAQDSGKAAKAKAQ